MFIGNCWKPILVAKTGVVDPELLVFPADKSRAELEQVPKVTTSPLPPLFLTPLLTMTLKCGLYCVVLYCVRVCIEVSQESFCVF